MDLSISSQEALLRLNKAFQKAAINAIPFFKSNANPKSEQLVEYRRRLNDLRLFLDNIGLKMPKKKFKYKLWDRNTWKYIEDLNREASIHNPNFIFW